MRYIVYTYILMYMRLRGYKAQREAIHNPEKHRSATMTFRSQIRSARGSHFDKQHLGHVAWT